VTTVHQFGGNWTEEKLRRLTKYLSACTTIFTRNRWASRYTTYYVDAFAGTGYRKPSGETEATTLGLFEEQDLKDVERFYKGSAQIALETEPSFDRYLFIEQNHQFVQELENLRIRYPDKAERIQIEYRDANSFLQDWCNGMDWRVNRAVMFLDPYGMSVNWTTIEAIGATKAVDLWILLPVGQAINRLLTRQRIPEGAWADKLTTFFGTEGWKDAFYHPRLQTSLFEIDTDDDLEKAATFENIGSFFAERLDTVFEKVADISLALRNSRNVPIYLLFFAASNPRGAPTAVQIAEDILGR
jgi:three-Cys-motif partner protein